MDSIVNTKPTVRIVMCTYNAKKFIREQLDSLKNQTYDNFKVYIYDDQSTDGTVEYINEYIKKNFLSDNFFIKRNIENLGAKRNFMNAFELNSDSDYIFFCDQDDIWDRNKVSEMMKIMLKEEQISKDLPILLCHDSIITDSNDNQIDTKTIGDVSFGHLIFNPQIQGCCMLINKSAIKLINVNCTEIIMHDWYISIIVSLKGKILKIKKTLIRYRQHENNVIGFSRISLQKRILKILSETKNKQISYRKSLLQLASIADSFTEEMLISSLPKYINEKNAIKVINILSKCNAFSRGLRGLYQKYLICKIVLKS